MDPSRSLPRRLVAELQIARTTRRLTKTSVPTPAGCNQRTSSKLRGKDGFSAVPFELPRQLRKAVDSRQAEAARDHPTTLCNLLTDRHLSQNVVRVAGPLEGSGED